MQFRTAAEGPLPIDAVWQRYADLERWAGWAPQITGVRCDSQRLAAGLSGQVVGPLGVRVPFEVHDVDNQRAWWTWTVGPNPVTFRLEHGLQSINTGTRAWLRIVSPLPLAPAAAAYLPLAHVALRRLVR